MTAPLGLPPTQKRLVRDAFVGKNAKAALGKPKSTDHRHGTGTPPACSRAEVVTRWP